MEASVDAFIPFRSLLVTPAAATLVQAAVTSFWVSAPATERFSLPPVLVLSNPVPRMESDHPKSKSGHVVSLLKTLKWLPVAFR